MVCAGVADQVGEFELVDEAEEVVEAVEDEAIPVPRPRNTAALIAPATILDRAAAWRRLRPDPDDRRVTGSLVVRSVAFIAPSGLSWANVSQSLGC